MAAPSVRESFRGGQEGARPAGPVEEAPVPALAAWAPRPDPRGCARRGAWSRLWASCSWGGPGSPQRGRKEASVPPDAKLPCAWSFPSDGYTVTYSLKVTVRQFAVTSVMIIFPKKGLNSLSGSSGSSWASAGGFSAAAAGAAATGAAAGASGFT